MTTPTPQAAPDPMPVPTPADGGAPQRTTWPTFSRGQVTFLIATPLICAVLLIFHPAPAGDDIYGSLRDEANRMVIVHLLFLPFIGLLGAALYLLLRDMPGRAAQVGRLAILPFVVFYAAGDAMIGLATGVLVDRANDLPAGERSGLADAGQELWDNFITDDLFIGIGAAAWIVAAIAAAVAYQRAGAPLSVWLLLGLSAMVSFHAPPIGPIGLLCFAAAVVLLTRAPDNDAALR
jgi:hypothetical protein